MIAAATESDLMAVDIMDFTNMIVRIVQMKDVPNRVKAEAIHSAECVFHKFIMSKIVSKCKNAAVPSSN